MYFAWVCEIQTDNEYGWLNTFCILCVYVHRANRWMMNIILDYNIIVWMRFFVVRVCNDEFFSSSFSYHFIWRDYIETLLTVFLILFFVQFYSLSFSIYFCCWYSLLGSMYINFTLTFFFCRSIHKNKFMVTTARKCIIGAFYSNLLKCELIWMKQARNIINRSMTKIFKL